MCNVTFCTHLLHSHVAIAFNVCMADLHLYIDVAVDKINLHAKVSAHT